MKNPFLKTPLLLNIMMLISAGIISTFCLLFGFSHVIEGIKQLIQGGGPDIPLTETLLGWTIVLIMCFTGIVMLIVVIATFKAIYPKI